jgi:maleate isomerase/arylmalonate decarboxylase
MPESLLDQATVYGTRAKIGVIVPPTNTANEAEWQRLLPAEVTLHAARMPLHTDTSSDAGRASLYRDIEHHAGQLALAGVDVIAYGCTAGSMLSPVTALAEHVTHHTGIAAVTTAQAIVQALHALKVKKLAIATPYHDALNAHEKHFFEDIGFEVVKILGLGYGQNGPDEFRNIARIKADAVLDLVRAVDRPDADAILISCTDLATLSVIDALEAKHRKPVISSNTATLWASLRSAGIDDSIDSGGTLLRDY